MLGTVVGVVHQDRLLVRDAIVLHGDATQKLRAGDDARAPPPPTALQRALNRLREQSARDGKPWEFERLKTFLTGDRPAPSYRQVAADLETTEDAVKMAVHRLRRRFGEALRAEIGETVAKREEIDDEIRHLLSVLRA